MKITIEGNIFERHLNSVSILEQVSLPFIWKEYIYVSIDFCHVSEILCTITY